MTFAHAFLMEHRPVERSSVMTPIQERLYSAAPHAERISACRRKRSGSDCSGIETLTDEGLVVSTVLDVQQPG
jgi:hypothetical protein